MKSMVCVDGTIAKQLRIATNNLSEPSLFETLTLLVDGDRDCHPVAIGRIGMMIVVFDALSPLLFFCDFITPSDLSFGSFL